ncbi:MAG: thioredoxin domain-containing protein [Patescibacteria group bacterium]
MSTNYEESIWTTIWNFLPGITKFLSVLAMLGLFFNIFGFAFSGPDIAVDDGDFDIPIQRSFNFVDGNQDAEVKLLYFEDYQCPACRGNQSTMRQVKSQYSERVGFIYKHLPLKSIHIYAETLAKGVQAAGMQDKYLEFAEQAFELQDGSRYSSFSIEEVARSVGLNVEQWNKDRNSDEVDKYVETDQEDIEDVVLSANSDGVVKPANSMTASNGQSIGTPASIIYKNGEVFDWWTGGLPVTELQAKLDRALE